MKNIDLAVPALALALRRGGATLWHPTSHRPTAPPRAKILSHTCFLINRIWAYIDEGQRITLIPTCPLPPQVCLFFFSLPRRYQTQTHFNWANLRLHRTFNSPKSQPPSLSTGGGRVMAHPSIICLPLRTDPLRPGPCRGMVWIESSFASLFLSIFFLISCTM